MRKIILSILCLFSLNVYAESFYTNYKLIQENNTKYLSEYEGNELKKVERKVVYNNYQEKTVYGDYYELGTAPTYLKYYDLNDFINKDVYAKEPYYIDDIQYQSLRISSYSETRFIVLRSFISSGILSNIKIKYNGELLNYNIVSSNYDYQSQLKTSHKIVLDLNEKRRLENLEMELVFEDDTLNQLSFMLDIVGTNIYYLGCPYIYYENDLYRTKDKELYYINFLSNTNFNNLLSNTSWIRKVDYNKTNSVNYFKKNANFYRYYTISKTYANIYTTIPLDGYKLDYNKKKTLYDYYERDYITVKDEIDSLDDISNIIIKSSIPIEIINTNYNIFDDYVLVVIKYEDNTFFKKYYLNLNNTNSNNDLVDDNKDEKNDNEVIVNNEENQSKEIINLEENNNLEEVISIDDNNFENIIDNEDKNIIDIDNNDILNTNKDSNIIDVTNNKNELPVNDIDFFYVQPDEIIVEKDYSTDRYYNNKNKEIKVNNKDDTLALLIPNEDIIINNSSNKKLNYILIIIILLIICVKFLTQYINKKKSFVEHV